MHMAKDNLSKINKNLVLPPRQKIVTAVLFTVSIVLMSIGILQILDMRKVTTGKPKLPQANDIITSDIKEPDETKPVINEYVVPADQPRNIIIDSIGVNGLIQKIGLNKDNSISVPSNINFAGWFIQSAKPGDEGLSILDGHVSGRYSDGVFKNLINVKVGDILQIEYGDKRIKKFEVVDSKTLPEKDSAPFLLKKRDDIKSQLNLITCGGLFNKSSQTFNDRIIVVAKLLN